MAIGKGQRALWVVTGSLALAQAGAARAEVNLVSPDETPRGPLDRVEVQVGGSIRAQYYNEMGGSDDGSYRHRGYDGGTRFRLHVNYHVSDDLKLLSFAELGVNTARVMGWHDHYNRDSDDSATNRRQVYFGFDSGRYGRLTLGKQNSVYYDTVGVRTDLWDHDMLAQAPGVGVSGDHDGSYRVRRSLKYLYPMGDFTFYLGWLFPDESLHLADHVDYQRHHGGSVGMDWEFAPDWLLSAAYSNVKADTRDDSDRNTWHQQITGSALTWTPGPWYVSVGGGYYTDFVPGDELRPDRYFAGDAYGVEYVARYTIPVDADWLVNLQPYVAGDRLSQQGSHDYQSNHQVVGLVTQFPWKLRLDIEHTFANTSDHEPDVTLARLRYDF